MTGRRRGNTPHTGLVDEAVSFRMAATWSGVGGPDGHPGGRAPLLRRVVSILRWRRLPSAGGDEVVGSITTATRPPGGPWSPGLLPRSSARARVTMVRVGMG